MANWGKAIASMAPYARAGFEGYAAQKQQEKEDALKQAALEQAAQQQALENELAQTASERQGLESVARIGNYNADNERLKAQTEMANLLKQEQADKIKNEMAAQEYYAKMKGNFPKIMQQANAGDTILKKAEPLAGISPMMDAPERTVDRVEKNPYAALAGMKPRQIAAMSGTDFAGTNAQKAFQEDIEKAYPEWAPNRPINPNAQQRLDMSLNNSDKQAYERLTGEAKKDVQAARGQFGKMFDISMRANRDMALIDKIKEGLASGDKNRIRSTNQQFRELTTGLNNVIGGSAAVSQIEDLTAKSYMMDMNELVQKMKNTPVDAVPVEWLDHLRHSFEAISNYNAQTYRDIMDFYKERGNTILSGTDYIEPFNRDIDKLTNLPAYKVQKKESDGKGASISRKDEIAKLKAEIAAQEAKGGK